MLKPKKLILEGFHGIQSGREKMRSPLTSPDAMMDVYPYLDCLALSVV